ncbi:WGR domain-containing protein, partial [Blyttiomyces helicus]
MLDERHGDRTEVARLVHEVRVRWLRGGFANVIEIQVAWERLTTRKNKVLTTGSATERGALSFLAGSDFEVVASAPVSGSTAPVAPAAPTAPAAPAASATGAKRKRGKAAAKEDAEDKVAEDEAAEDEEAEEEAPPAKIVKTIRKGKSVRIWSEWFVVDHLCPVASSSHVFTTADGVYDAMLNQTEISRNNNKFYIIQLLQSDSGSKVFHVWTRWGRVGADGQRKLDGPYGDVEAAKRAFESKFKDK